ncbi:MAG: hypothetical protein MPN21_09790 [Thermoanaerobaculia bacterium]|nr:hypothetical protein [Thermoanaerobaculia bacterium]
MRYVAPGTAGKVLTHHRYWTVQFLELYLERCDEIAFDVPADAYLLAQHAPEVARRTRVGPEAREFDTPLDKLSGIVMALAVKGSCCRAHEELAEAALCFRRAFEGVRGRTASTSVMAELHRRYAALLAVGREQETALQHLEQSLTLADQAGDRDAAADGLALRGYLQSEARPAEAVLDFIQASRLADLRSRRGERTAQAALYNLIATLAMDSVGLRDQETALKLLQGLKDHLKGTPTSVRKMKVLWIEGLILANLKIDRHAERQLMKARSGFEKLRQPVDFGVVSMDLAKFHLSRGAEAACRSLASETWDTLKRLGPDPEQLEIIRIWCEKGATVHGTDRARRALLDR